MKTKIMKVIGVLLTASLVLSMFAVAAPVSAAPGENEWDTIGMPDLDPGTDVGVMAIDADGNLIAAVDNGVDWDIMISEDEGYTWDDFVLSGLDEVADIEISVDGTVYVATVYGDVYRIADGEATLLKAIVDSFGSTVGILYEIDVWNDGSNNWVLVATNLDVLVLKDALFEDWRDQEMATGGDSAWAVWAEFAPDFAESEVIWAIAEDETNTYFELTATVSPGQWGMALTSYVFTGEGWDSNVDVAFSDNYDSEDYALLYVALVDGDYGSGNLYMVQASETTTEADALFPSSIDVRSVEVSGDTILVADTDGNLYISTNAGDTFAEAVKRPSGNFYSNVYMAPGYTAEEGTVYVTTSGYASAFNISRDGGNTFNSISWMDLSLNNIVDIAFNGDTAYMVTTGAATSYSLWRTDDVTAENPGWERVLSEFTHMGMNFEMMNIEVALDGSAIFMDVNNGDDEIWKSTDNAQTWSHWRDLPGSMTSINDWVIVNSTTMYAATNDGFWGTSAFGPATVDDFANLNSIDVDGDTIAVGYSTGGNVAVSTDAGETWGDPINIGSDAVFVAFGPDGVLYAASSDGDMVIVDPDAADPSDVVTDLEDSTGGTADVEAFSGLWVSPDNVVYALGGDEADTEYEYGDPVVNGTLDFEGVSSSVTDDLVLVDVSLTVTSGSFGDTDAIDVVAANVTATSSTILEGTVYLEGPSGTATVDVMVFTSSGFTAGEDVMVTESTTGLLVCDVEEIPVPITGYQDLFRILVTEHHSLWETANIDDAVGLWGTQGSNILWTTVDTDLVPGLDTIYAFEDTLVTAVELDSPETGAVVAGKTSATVSWNEVDGATAYDLVYMPVGGSMATDKIAVYGIEATSYTITGLADNTEYCWMVRVTAPYNGKTSEARTFTTTDDVEAPVAAPDLMPINGAYNVPVKGPAFAWTFAGEQPDAYTWELSTDPLFGSTLATATLTVPYVVYDGTLDYETAYYWRVNAVTDAGGASGWVTSVFTTAAEEMAPVEVDEQQPPVINLTVPDSETPGYIWAIIAIGALLTIAVIVLIVRTRRVV